MAPATCCAKHPSELATSACRRCGFDWCPECLVFSFGAEKPPFCITCALVTAGVKTRGFPPMSRKQLRARKKAEKLAARGGPAPTAVHTPAPEPAPAPANDWSNPWWEQPASKGLTAVD
jgi:hypothetical protein